MSRSAAQPSADRYSARVLIRRLLMEQALAHWKLYVLAFALMGVVAGATSLTAYLIGSVVNQTYVNKNLPAITALALVIIVLFTVKGAANYGQAVLMARIGARIVAQNQRRMFSKLLNEGLGYFADRHSSEFVARLATGANAATWVINLLITAAGRDFLSLVGLAAVMVVQDPLLSMVSVIVAPPAILVLRKLVRRIRTVAMNQFTNSARAIETMQEALQGFAIVKAFTLEDDMRRRFEASVAGVERESFKMARVANRTGPLMETLGGIAVAIAVIYCGYRVIDGGRPPGEFFSFMTAFLLAYEPAKRLARLNLDLNSSLVGVRVLFEVIDSPTTEPADEDQPDLTLTAARVEFAAVQFSYRPGEPVLRGMSFVAEPGRMTALVGPSGSGKSTVLNLLLRFYEVDSGSIAIDGQNIAAVSRRSLRQHIAYVGQNVYLFRGTIRENIALGHIGASEAEIIAAATAAHAHEFISAFPAGYDTPVGEHGLHLSGGQRQRIAIARALIKNAPIILLDEATAALDSESEQLVQAAIAELCHGRTTIIIAHRLSTIMHADRILVIEGGRVVESGRHDDLLRAGGRYSLFYRLQLKQQTTLQAPAAE